MSFANIFKKCVHYNLILAKTKNKQKTKQKTFIKIPRNSPGSCRLEDRPLRGKGAKQGDQEWTEPGKGATAHTQPAEATSKIEETVYTHWKRREKCHDLPAMYFSTYKV